MKVQEMYPAQILVRFIKEIQNAQFVANQFVANESIARRPETARLAARSVTTGNSGLESGNMCRCHTCCKSFRGRQGTADDTQQYACVSQKQCRLCYFQCGSYKDLDKHGELRHKGQHIYVCKFATKGLESGMTSLLIGHSITGEYLSSFVSSLFIPWALVTV